MATTNEVIYKMLSETAEMIGVGKMQLPDKQIDQWLARKDETIELRQVQWDTLALIHEYTFLPTHYHGADERKHRDAIAMSDRGGLYVQEPVGVLYSQIDDVDDVRELLKKYVAAARGEL